MERIKTLNYYQKGIIIVMVAMILIFAVIYPKTGTRPFATLQQCVDKQ